MRCFNTAPALIAAVLLVGLVAPQTTEARNPIRSDFFDAYPNALGTQLDGLPSDSKHCGVCHFDFAGGGPRNPYGFGIEIGIGQGLSATEAILAIEGDDSDTDGFSNLTEITSLIFSNTPTFPGLSDLNKGSTSNIPLGEIEPYLTPSGGSDTTPPTITLDSHNGGESEPANNFTTVSFTATDASGISHVNLYFSDDGGSSFKPIARNEPGSGTYSWFVPNLPSVQCRLRVTAFDNAGNSNSDDSDADFTVTIVPGGLVPTTLRDMELAGTQPFEGAVLDDPADCFLCHGGYDPNVEPHANWAGSMMGQAMRDPLFLACMAVAEQDAPSVGDLCIRCHTPGGWQEGRSVDTSGGLLTDKDFEGIQCDFCHRAVDYNYAHGISPPQDTLVLAGISPLPLQYGNGQFINDPQPLRRGPFDDAAASHDFAESPFHRSSDICGTCHDVSNPVYVRTGPADYVLNNFDEEHPDMDVRNMFPVERTFSEWSVSEYASTGVFAPQFAGDKPDGIVSTCQDCHMRDVTGLGCNENGTPIRTDLPLHDMMGGNTFVQDILPIFYPGMVDTVALQASKQRAIAMLQLAATLTITPEDFGVTVRVTNETAHKLPSGYPEGRRIWLHVAGEDINGSTVFESGVYNPATGELPHDDQFKVYEVHPGLSPAVAAALGFPAGPSFHFVLSDTVYFDNRIPPRGFTNAAFETIQSPPVGYTYADGEYWDDTQYTLPAETESVTVTLYYQTTTKEYIEFLRDANVTNSAGLDLYNAWVATGRSAPIAMETQKVGVNVTATEVADQIAPTPLPFALGPALPNPFRGSTTISYSIPSRTHVSIAVFDLTGRLVRSLVDETRNAERRTAEWDGSNDDGVRVSSGVYLIRFEAGDRVKTRRAVLLR